MRMTKRRVGQSLLAGLGLALMAGTASAATTLTIGTVNNADMLVMQDLSKQYEQQHPDIKINWVVLEENVLRQRLTTDIATKAGNFDIMTIGSYEAPIWGKRGWLVSFDSPPASYDMEDVLPSVRSALSEGGKLYAVPFYAESQMTFYRKDLFDKAGLTMPEEPTWADMEKFAAKLNDPKNGVYGICLRGKPGWGENVGQITPVANSYGARWFDMDWKPDLESQGWKDALNMYTGLIKKYGPPGAASNGYNETLALFATGKCAMWADATVSAGFLTNPKQSTVSDKLGYALQPYGKEKVGYHYLWSWALGVPSSSKNQEAAQDFIYWATSKDYIKLVADKNGWAAVPPGTRKSTYDNPEYQKAAPFAAPTLKSIETADPNHATVEKVPYSGIQFVGIPEWQAIGTTAGQAFAAIISGQQTVDQALATVQRATTRTMTQAGYIKK